MRAVRGMSARWVAQLLNRHACDTQAVEHLDEVWPVTIVRARYGGIYEPGVWLAFPSHPDALPIEWDAGDIMASSYYEDHSHEIGGGSTPDEAYDNLRTIMRRRRSEH
jgi:hypothetical protein